MEKNSDRPQILPDSNVDFGKLIVNIVANAKHLTPAMQNAIARWLDYQANPMVKMSIKPEDIFREKEVNNG